MYKRQVYVGFTVLDVSKTIMYDFHYRYAVAKYGHNVKLLMTDTDSLMYHIQTSDLYADMKEDLHVFDTSDYPTTHPCYSIKNKKVVGLFKDETCGRPIREFVGLRAKCYSFLVAHEDSSNAGQKRVCKGVPRVAIKRSLRHDMYRKCLTDHCRFSVSALCLRSDHHTLYTCLLYTSLPCSALDGQCLMFVYECRLPSMLRGRRKLLCHRKGCLVWRKETMNLLALCHLLASRLQVIILFYLY